MKSETYQRTFGSNITFKEGDNIAFQVFIITAVIQLSTIYAISELQSWITFFHSFYLNFTLFSMLYIWFMKELNYAFLNIIKKENTHLLKTPISFELHNQIYKICNLVIRHSLYWNNFFLSFFSKIFNSNVTQTDTKISN